MTTIFLLAGEAKRMRENKMLLPYKDKYLFESTLESALNNSDRIIAVLGNEEERMREALSPYSEYLEIRFNKDYKSGQKSSTLVGLEEVYDDVAILPGDLPLLSDDDWIVGLRYISLCLPARPLHNETLGHPVFVPRRLIKGLRESPKPFKEYLVDCGIYTYPASIGTVFDIDTKDRYQELLNNDSAIFDR